MINLPVLLLHLDFLGLLLSVVVPIILHLNYVIIPSVFFTLHAPAAIFSEAAAITNFDAPSTHRYEKKTEGDENDRIGDAGVFKILCSISKTISILWTAVILGKGRAVIRVLVSLSKSTLRIPNIASVG